MSPTYMASTNLTAQVRTYYDVWFNRFRYCSMEVEEMGSLEIPDPDNFGRHISSACRRAGRQEMRKRLK